MSQAACDDVMGAQSIDAVEMIPRAPDTSDSGGMKDNVNALASSRHCLRIA
jgi:hypothetical protein